MNSASVRRSVILTLILAGLGTFPGAGRLLAGEEDSARVKSLIELLASKNKAEQRGGMVRIGSNYDRQAQAVVFLAIQGLLNEGEDAFDLLISHAADNRYSYTYESPAGEFNKSVGWVCTDILARSIECYEPRMHYITKDQFRPYVRKHVQGSNWAQWWEKNKDRPLWQIQIDAIDEQIAFMKSVDRDTANSTHHYAKKLDPEIFNQRRQENLKILQAMRSAIELLKEPYRPTNLDQTYGYMKLLPWPTRSFGR